jgi:WD40 repeat protein
MKRNFKYKVADASARSRQRGQFLKLFITEPRKEISIGKFKNHSGEISGICFSPDSLKLAVGINKTVYIIDTNSNSPTFESPIKMIDILLDLQGTQIGDSHGLEQEMNSISQGTQKIVSLRDFFLERGAVYSKTRKKSKSRLKSSKTPQ